MDFTKIIDVKKGTKQILKIYKGDTLVWSLPSDWVEQNGSVLTIRGAVTVTQSASTLTIS